MNEPIFRDVAREELVRLEAQRCGGCKQECLSACPVGIDIPKMMEFLKDGYFDEAGALLVNKNPMATITGRLCDAPCTRACPRKINIRGIEKWLGDKYRTELKPGRKRKIKVAIVGAGLAGLTAAEECVKKGYKVTLFEATPNPGGFMEHFVSKDTLPKKIKEKLIERIMSHVDFKPRTIVGANPRVQDLQNDFDITILATGANQPTTLQVPNEHLQNIYTPNEFLRGAVPPKKVPTVIIGSSQVALDCAMLAAKKGNQVTIIDRKGQQSLSLDEHTIMSASEAGIRFMLLTQPIGFTGEKKVEGVTCQQMMVTQSDFDDSWITSPIEDSDFTVPAERVIVATGFDPNPSMKTLCEDLRTVGKGRLYTDQDHMTNMDGVFAAGEIALGSSSPAKTIAHAKKVVAKIEDLLTQPPDLVTEVK